MDEGKIRDIVQWPVPQSVHDVRMFLGICGYYRRFSKNYAEVAAPLHELTRKLEPFVWTDRRQRAFESLKEHLTTAPVLAMSQDDGQFVLDVDASDIAAGAVLQQKQDGELRVIGYASRIFHDCERNYCVTKRELAALVFVSSVSVRTEMYHTHGSFCVALPSYSQGISRTTSSLARLY